MFGFSGKQFKNDLEDFVQKHGNTIVDKASTAIHVGINKLKEAAFPELKGWEKTSVKDGKYTYVIIMAGLKKENISVDVKDGHLIVVGKNSEGLIVVDFKQVIGKDTVDSAKLLDGIMTISLTVAPENSNIKVE